MASVKNLSPIEMKRLKEIVDDPVLWSQACLRTFNPETKTVGPWRARWYQVEMMRDKSVKKVYRCGRRIGKCLPEDAVVYDPLTGENKTVGELYEEGKAHLLTMTEDYKLKAHFTNEIYENGMQEVFRVTTKTGRFVDATGNHPLFTARGWETIDSLKPGDKVAIAGNLGFFGSYRMSGTEIKLLAYMIGDGNCTSKAIRFCTNSDLIYDEMQRAVNYFDCELIQYNSNRDIDYNIVKKHNRQNNNYPNTVKDLLDKHGLFGKSAHTKFVPKAIFKLNKNDTATFLSRLYSTDGWAHTKSGKQQIGYSSSSLQLIRDVQHLILKFGINSYINKKISNYKGSQRTYYQLLITNSNDVIKFYKEIGIFAKQEACKKAFESALENNKYDTYLPKEILEKVEEDRLAQHLTKAKLCEKSPNSRLRLNHDVQRSRLKEYGQVLNNQDLIAFSEGEFIFDEIDKIESLGEKKTYHFSIPVTGNFVVNDFITHNTETMVVEMLHQVFSKRNFRVLMAAPFENQIRNMFTRLNELIKESPILKNEIVSSTKNPYKIELKNGSMILGFTAGDDAASIRGQRADWIYIDEIDFMSEYCFEVIAAVAIERPDIGITVSSTPLGKRSHFYKMCTEPEMGYSQHYHPSTHNPNWSEKMEAELRAQLTAEGYVHEVLAEFGTQEKGVFPKDKLDSSREYEYYAYNELSFFQQKKCEEEGFFPTMNIYSRENPAPYNPFRCMGVDWDKYGASSSIIILDFDVKWNKFKVIKRVEVARGEYSYDNAINTIVELNEIYNPSYIYCDAGAGEYQIERLHIIGDERPETGLKNKVKRWQFAQTLDVTDPITYETVKEPLKPFMVNQLTLAFERDRIMMSPFDDVLHKQLTDYEVEKVTENGKPKYSSKDEHFIDALGLAYLAFVLEFKELTKTVKDIEHSSKVAFSNNAVGKAGVNRMLHSIEQTYGGNTTVRRNNNDDDLPGDKPRWVKVASSYSPNRTKSSWGSRRGYGSSRTMW